MLALDVSGQFNPSIGPEERGGPQQGIRSAHGLEPLPTLRMFSAAHIRPRRSGSYHVRPVPLLSPRQFRVSVSGSLGGSRCGAIPGKPPAVCNVYWTRDVFLSVGLRLLAMSFISWDRRVAG